MILGLAKRSCIFAMLLGITAAANASFHLWQISEIYSNADGTIQFIELRTSAGGQQFLAGHAITSSQGATTRTFTIPVDLPGNTTNRNFLIGTQGFAALGLVAPDYVVPNNFLFITNGTVNWAGVDIVSYASLPTNGTLSIDRNGVTGVNSPTNFSGQTGSITPATAPGAPVIGAATPGSGQATIDFGPPASTGGVPITGYTVTCNPGAVSAAGTAPPITVTGLTNGTSYACSVTAANAAGTGPASATVNVTPRAVVKSFTGTSPTGTGTVMASFTGGGATCGFGASRLIALVGDPASPPSGSAPADVAFPHGLFLFSTTGCTAGSTITMTMTYPAALPAATQYWKYGPTAAQPAPSWYALPATISGNSATFTITDGDLGDDDLSANGAIADQGGPGIPAPVGGGASIPTMSEWVLILLAAVLGLSGLVATRRIAR